MNGFFVIMFIFGLCVLIVGFYMFTGHEIFLLTGSAAFKGLTKSEWKNIGKWTMISSVIIFVIAIIGWIFNFQ